MLQINGKVFGNEYFGNNEVIYKDIGIESPVTIQLNFQDTRDLANLDMAVEYIRDKLGDETPITLYMPYLPYSGMDRGMGEQLFSLKHIGNILNRLNFDKVIIRDPHNKDETIKRVNNVEFESIQKFVDQVIAECNPDIIFFPDAGAVKKYSNDIDTHGLPVIHGVKARNIADKGHINSYRVEAGDVNILGKNVLIIDDICRKGGTFMAAGNRLKEMGASNVYLYVTHCERWMLDANLPFEGSPIDRMWFTDSEVEIVNYLPVWKKDHKYTMDINILH